MNQKQKFASARDRLVYAIGSFGSGCIETEGLKPMPIGLTVRPPQAEDRHAWRRLWNGYCAALGGVVSDEVTEGIWERLPIKVLPPGSSAATGII
jgi:hypothetical protein